MSRPPAGGGHPGAGPGRRHPLLVVLSGPSGAGKERSEGFRVPVTRTTRPPRPGERDGRDYIFVSEEEFELAEHARVYGRRYGVPRSELRRALDGSDAIVRVDVQGAATLRARLPGALFVYLEAVSAERLAERMRARGEAAEEIARRLRESEAEEGRREHFDHVVLNEDGDLDAAVDELLAIIERARRRPERPALEL